MRNYNRYYFIGAILLSMLTLQSCEIIADIFATGFWVGLIVAVLVVALVIWLIVKGRKKLNR